MMMKSKYDSNNQTSEVIGENVEEILIKMKMMMVLFMMMMMMTK